MDKTHYEAKLFKWVKEWFEIEKKDLGVILIYASVMGLFSLILPVAVQNLVNNVAFGVALQPIFILSLIVLVSMVFAGVLKYAEHWVAEYLTLRLVVRKTKEMETIQGRRNQKELEGVQNAFFLEIFQIRKQLSYLVIEGVDVALILSTGLLVLAFYHPYLLIFDLFIIGAILFFLKSKAEKGPMTAVESSNAKYELFHAFQSPKPDQNLNGFIENFLRARKDHFQVLTSHLIGIIGLQIFASVGLLSIGGVLVMKKALSLGQLVAAELILTGVIAGIGKLHKILENYYALIASHAKVEKLKKSLNEGAYKS